LTNEDIKIELFTQKQASILVKYYFYLFSCSILLQSCLVFRPGAEKLMSEAKKNAPFDVVIVPGVPFNGKTWDPIMKARVNWAAHLYHQKLTKNIIFSGSSVYTPYVEAKIMALYGEKLGVPKDCILTECRAEHSTENVFFSYKMALEKGFSNIAVATDPFQSKLLMGFTKRRFKKKISHIPIIFKELKTVEKEVTEINHEEAKVENFKSIVERQSKNQRFKGTMGKFIPWEELKHLE
jgi:uncharacterized SAM-binding protein YcdF (DUF218 family)